ncbi:unnamed protein product [Allacma fusca]|uniref:G-protein coupled receptors family 1 profile domain-containing protein n=1 Tax=Allacma fusca TaxID=39272 RepID=A0A8J2JH90_9HEXA|nr:unnamed protein product [Allacma fusca]
MADEVSRIQNYCGDLGHNTHVEHSYHLRIPTPAHSGYRAADLSYPETNRNVIPSMEDVPAPNRNSKPFHSIKWRFKCREMWPNPESEKIFNLFLDFLLLLIPLCIMGMAYSLIVSKLWKGLRREILHTRSFTPASNNTGIGHPEPSLELSGHSHYSVCKVPGSSTAEPTRTAVRVSASRDGVSNEIITFRGGKGVVVRWKRKEVTDGTDNCNCTTTKRSSPDTISNHQCQSNRPIPNPATPVSKFSRAIRSTYTGKSIESKKKVIRMLFVLVAEFFLAWTPLFVMNTWYLFNPEAVYNRIGPMGIAGIQLLAYTSSCTNPITYCFMNRKFRQAFLKVFQFGFAPRSKLSPPTIGRGSDLSANDSLIYGVQGSTMNKSEVPNQNPSKVRGSHYFEEGN